MEKLSLSLAPDDLVVVDRLVQRFALVRRHAVCRAALRAGLEQFARDHDYALEHLTNEVQKSRSEGGAK